MGYLTQAKTDFSLLGPKSRDGSGRFDEGCGFGLVWAKRVAFLVFYSKPQLAVCSEVQSPIGHGPQGTNAARVRMCVLVQSPDLANMRGSTRWPLPGLEISTKE